MKKLLLTFIVFLTAICANARSMKELWASIPDSLVPYVDKIHRLEMTDFIGMGLKGDVDNIMGSKSVMDTITNNFIHVTLSEASTLQVKRLPAAEGDSIICVVRTWKAPESESYVSFYDQQWQRLDKSLELKAYIPQLLSRPDTMSVDNYNKLLENVDFTMVNASFSPDSDDLTLSLSVPVADKDKAKQLRHIVKSITLKP